MGSRGGYGVYCQTRRSIGVFAEIGDIIVGRYLSMDLVKTVYNIADVVLADKNR